MTDSPEANYFLRGAEWGWFHLEQVLVPSLTAGLAIFAVLGSLLDIFVARTSMTVWDVLLVAAFTAAAFFIIRFEKPRFAPTLSAGQWSPVGLVLSVLALAVLLPGLIALVGSPRDQLSASGGMHSQIVYEVLRGAVPPDNPAMAGAPISNYWMYHVLLAIIVHVTEFTAPQAGAALNILALIGTVVWCISLLKELPLSARARWLLPALAILVTFGGNLLGVIWASDLVGKLIRSPFHLLMHHSYHKLVLLGDTRLSNLDHKYLSFSGMPLGIMFFEWGLVAGLQALKDKIRAGVWLAFVGAIAAALAYHTVTGTYMALILPASLVLTWLVQAYQTSSRSGPPRWPALKEALGHRLRVFQSRSFVFVFLVSIVAVIGIGHLVLTGVQAAPSSGALHLRINLEKALTLLAFMGPLLLPALFGLVAAYRQRAEAVYFLAFVAIAGSFAWYMTYLPDGNEYKFIYLSTIAVACGAVYALQAPAKFPLFRPDPLIRQAITVVLVLLVSADILFVGIAWLTSGRHQDTSFYFQDGHVWNRLDPYTDVYAWLNEQSPADAVVVIPRWDLIYAPEYAVLERQLLVAEGTFFTEGFAGYEERLGLVTQFYTSEASSETRLGWMRQLAEIDTDGPLYIVVPFSLGINPQEVEATHIYRGEQADLYLLHP